MGELQSYFAAKYYSEPFMAASAIVALAVSIKKYRRHRELRPFTYLVLFSLVVTAIDFYRVAIGAKPPAFKAIVVTMSNLFGAAEFIVYSRYVLFIDSSLTSRRIVKISALLYFAALIAFSVRNYYCIFITPDYLVTTIFLIPVCLAYFYELLTTANPRPLRDRPGFWVITGAFLVNGGTIPLMLSANYLGGYYNIAYSLNYILFGILFLLLTRAYFCPADEPELKE